MEDQYGGSIWGINMEDQYGGSIWRINMGDQYGESIWGGQNEGSKSVIITCQNALASNYDPHDHPSILGLNEKTIGLKNHLPTTTTNSNQPPSKSSRPDNDQLTFNSLSLSQSRRSITSIINQGNLTSAETHEWFPPREEKIGARSVGVEVCTTSSNTTILKSFEDSTFRDFFQCLNDRKKKIITYFTCIWPTTLI